MNSTITFGRSESSDPERTVQIKSYRDATSLVSMLQCFHYSIHHSVWEQCVSRSQPLVFDPTARMQCLWYCSPVTLLCDVRGYVLGRGLYTEGLTTRLAVNGSLCTVRCLVWSWIFIPHSSKNLWAAPTWFKFYVESSCMTCIYRPWPVTSVQTYYYFCLVFHYIFFNQTWLYMSSCPNS